MTAGVDGGFWGAGLDWAGLGRGSVQRDSACRRDRTWKRSLGVRGTRPLGARDPHDWFATVTASSGSPSPVLVGGDNITLVNAHGGRLGSVVALLGALLLTSACSTPGTVAGSATVPTPQLGTSVTATAPTKGTPVTHPAPGGGIVVALGHGWTAAGVQGHVQPPGSCHLRWTADSEPLPDPTCTPGAAAVTADGLSSTVCRPGAYTSSVPSRSVCRRQASRPGGIWDPLFPNRQLRTGQPHRTRRRRCFRPRNRWPQLNGFVAYRGGPYLENDKDAVERVAFNALCARRITLGQVQSGMAKDWTILVVGLGLPRPPRRTR